MYQNILIPIMLNDPESWEKSFTAARSLADDPATFTIVHVVEPLPTYVMSEFPTDVLSNARSEAQAALAHAAAQLPGAASALLTGPAGNEILNYADQHDCDCIIIASHQPGLSDYFLGSTAGRVVRHAKCAVHVMR